MKYHTISCNTTQYHAMQGNITGFKQFCPHISFLSQGSNHLHSVIQFALDRTGVSRISNMTSSCPQVTHVKHVKHPTSLCPISFSRTCLIQFSLYYCEFRLVLHSGKKIKKKQTAFEHPLHSTVFKIHDVPPFSS